MATEKQIAANRRNSLKSTGPRTEIGKAISSKNGVTHGLASGVEVQIIEGESQEAFTHLANSFFAELNPAGQEELAILDTLVQARWRQMRVRSMANQAITREIHAAADESAEVAVQAPIDQATQAVGRLADPHSILRLLNTYEAHFFRQMMTCRRELLRSRDRRRQEAANINPLFG